METLDWMVLWKMLFHSVSHDASGLHNCQVMMSLILLHNWSPDVGGGSGPLKRRAFLSISLCWAHRWIGPPHSLPRYCGNIGRYCLREERSKMPKSMGQSNAALPPTPTIDSRGIRKSFHYRISSAAADSECGCGVPGCSYFEIWGFCSTTLGIHSGWHLLCLFRLKWEQKWAQREALSRKWTLFMIKL